MELVQIHPLGDPQNGGVATFVGNWLGVEDYVMVNDDAVRFVREDERRDTIADAILSSRTTRCGFWWIPRTSRTTAWRRSPTWWRRATASRPTLSRTWRPRSGVDPSTLAETIEGYNACVAAGKDTQIAPGKELLGDAVSDPSFYASKRIPTIHYTMGGVCISPEAQVLTAAGEAIPGLFAAGEVTGGVQGANRLGGNSYTDLIVFGRHRRRLGRRCRLRSLRPPLLSPATSPSLRRGARCRSSAVSVGLESGAMMRARGALHLCAMVSIPYIICSVLSFIPALVLHEVAHGYAAYKLGDPTAKRSGRLSLNPLKHIDPFGTVILPLLLMVMGWPVFGYAKPVPYNPRYFKDPRRDDVIVGLAGPSANLAMAALAAAVAWGCSGLRRNPTFATTSCSLTST